MDLQFHDIYNELRKRRKIDIAVAGILEDFHPRPDEMADAMRIKQGVCFEWPVVVEHAHQLELVSCSMSRGLRVYYVILRIVVKPPYLIIVNQRRQSSACATDTY